MRGIFILLATNAPHGILQLLESNSGLTFIGGIIGSVLTLVARRYSSKKNVESIYLERINEYMSDQDKKIQAQREEINSLKESNLSKDQDNDHLKEKVRYLEEKNSDLVEKCQSLSIRLNKKEDDT